MCDESAADVSIILGKIPQRIKDLSTEKTEYRVSLKELYFDINEVKYYIKDGSQIIVEIPEKPDYATIYVCLTGICMATILLQRGFIPIHGSCIVIDGKGIVLTGNSGAGKSSLCFAFRQQQYEFLSDDISVISPDDADEIMVYPSHPQQRLDRQLLKKMGYEFLASDTSSFDGKIVINSTHRFRNKPVPLAAIFELRKGNGEVRCKRVTGTEKIRSIIDNTIYASVFSSLGISTDYFLKYVKIAREVDYFILERPWRGDSIKEQMRHIIDYMSREHDVT